MHYHKYTGIIIKKTPLKDADYFLTILTKEHGKLTVYARGARSIKSKRRANLDYYTEINFETVEKNNRHTLINVDLVDGFREAKNNLTDISRLFIIGELVDGLLPEAEEADNVYSLLHKAISNLHAFDTPLYLTRFKTRLLSELGYGQDNMQEEALDSYIESLLERSIRARQLGS